MFVSYSAFKHPCVLSSG